MIGLLKNIFGNKQKEVTSLRKTSNIEISEPEYQSEIPELIKKKIEEPKITELTEEEIQESVNKEIELAKNQIDSGYFINNSFLGTSLDIDISERDSMFREAAEIVVVAQQGSTSLIQRKLKLGYNRAGRLIDQLEAAGIVGAFRGSEARVVLIPDLVALEHFFKNEDKPKIKSIKEIKQDLFVEKYLPLYQDQIAKITREYEQNKIDEIEKEKIKQEYLEKERKRKLRQEAKQELLKEGLLNKSNAEQRSISQEVKDLVWNRDNGRCVQCGSNKKLEFDHIIPFSKGGSNTYRNIQLLCEECNREKSNKIG